MVSRIEYDLLQFNIYDWMFQCIEQDIIPSIIFQYFFGAKKIRKDDVCFLPF